MLFTRLPWKPAGLLMGGPETRERIKTVLREELKMKKAVCAWVAMEEPKAGEGAHRFCGRHPEFPSYLW